MNLISLGNQIINLDKITRVKALGEPEKDDPNFCIQIFFESSKITVKGKAAFVIWRKIYWMANSDLGLLLNIKPQNLQEQVVVNESNEKLQSLNN